MLRRAWRSHAAVVLVLAVPLIAAHATTGAAVSAATTTSCSQTPIPPAAGRPAPLIAANNNLAFSLYARLAAGSSGNVFLSPASISLALDMLYDGAKGATRQEMARTLGLADLTPQQVRADAAQWIRLLRYHRASGSGGNPDAFVAVANSLWTRRSVPFQLAFIRQLATYYGAPAQALDFASPSALSTINGWVACSTHGAIKKIVDMISPQALLYLINAVYFKGQWFFQFSPGETHPQAFHTAGGRSITVPMMHQSGHVYEYYAGQDFQVAELPYTGFRYSMVILLPSPGLSPQAFAPRLTRANWGYWMAHLVTRPGTLALPRFQFRYGASLNQALQSLGMTRAFGPYAQFGNMCTRFCYVSRVLHKTYLHVDERGTIAAGVTTVEVGGGGGGPQQPPFVMTVDHPFYLAIRDDRNGALLFLGSVANPLG